MDLNTDEQEEALSLLMRETARRELNKRQACRLLYSGEDSVYKRSRDAARFVKDVVEDSEIPIEAESGKVVRKDVSVPEVEG